MDYPGITRVVAGHLAHVLAEASDAGMKTLTLAVVVSTVRKHVLVYRAQLAVQVVMHDTHVHRRGENLPRLGTKNDEGIVRGSIELTPVKIIAQTDERLFEVHLEQHRISRAALVATGNKISL